MSETPAETLRRAAKLMRERAEAATPWPWAWEATGDKDSSWAVGFVQDEDGNPLTGEIGQGEGIVIDGVCESIAGNPTDGAHIAAMHPGLALAIAEWLDKVAADPRSSLPSWVEAGALAIACAYLSTGTGAEAEPG